MVPFTLYETYKIKSIVPEGEYTIHDQIAVIENEKGSEIPLTMVFEWPVKKAINAYTERTYGIAKLNSRLLLNVISIDISGDLHKPRQCMTNELLVRLTEVRFLRPFTRLNFLVLHTPPTTKS